MVADGSTAIMKDCDASHILKENVTFHSLEHSFSHFENAVTVGSVSMNKQGKAV